MTSSLFSLSDHTPPNVKVLLIFILITYPLLSSSSFSPCLLSFWSLGNKLKFHVSFFMFRRACRFLTGAGVLVPALVLASLDCPTSQLCSQGDRGPQSWLPWTAPPRSSTHRGTGGLSLGFPGLPHLAALLTGGKGSNKGDILVSCSLSSLQAIQISEQGKMKTTVV